MERRGGGGGGKILRRKSIVPRHARKKQDMLKAEQGGGEVGQEKWNTCVRSTSFFPRVECATTRSGPPRPSPSLSFRFSTGDEKDERTGGGEKRVKNGRRGILEECLEETMCRSKMKKMGEGFY